MRNKVPLRARVVRGVLTIEIDASTLAWAFEHSPSNEEYNAPDDGEPGFVKRCRVTNKREFARDVVREMQDEAEAGSTPLSNFIDAMCTKAVEQGSIAVEDTKEQP